MKKQLIRHFLGKYKHIYDSGSSGRYNRKTLSIQNKNKNKKMENNKNPPSIFPAYFVGDAVTQGHVVYQNMVVLVSIYIALQLGANPQAAVQPEPQRFCHFKLPIFAGKEDDNLQNWLKNAFNKLHLYDVPKRHWVRESANF